MPPDELKRGVSLALARPDIAAEWHPFRNGLLIPNEVSSRINRKVWWLGACGHEWESLISSRVGQGAGCPICDGKKVLAGFNDLASKRPEVALQWHPTKNGSLTSEMVSPSSGKKVWLLGPCGHEWDAVITSRTTKNSGCPVCAGKRVLQGFNDLATLHPGIAADWHPVKNGDLKPTDVVSRSDKRIWWLGPCCHEWDVKVVDRVQYSTGCPYCRGNLRVMPGVNDLATLQPLIAGEWHPTKNGSLKPSDVREFSTKKKIWWLAECGHEWQSTVAHRSGGRKCPFCAGKKILVGFNDLATTDPVIAAEWHPTKNGDLTPEMVSRGTDKKVWWSSHGHEWISAIPSRASGGQGCAICTGDQVQVGLNDLATTHPLIAEKWHPTKNGAITPESLTAGSKKRIWWLGECGHSWIADVMHITSGRGCAVCRGLQIELGVNDLASQYPEVATQWHPTKNGDLTPEMVSPSSGRKVWWICEKGHTWCARVAGRQYGAVGCPGCAAYGFSPSKEGWLYLLSHPFWGMQQIGISNVPESRVSQHTRLGWQVMEIRGPMDGFLVQALEQEALKALYRRGAKLGVPSPTGGFDGHTESWPTQSLKLDNFRQLLDWVYEDESQITEIEHLQAWSPPLKQPRGPIEKLICIVEGCEMKYHGHGYCRLHYRRWKATGNPGPLGRVKKPNGSYTNSECSVEGCSKIPVGQGFCPMHHRRFLKTGDPGRAESTVVNPKDRICTVNDCSTPWFAKKMCEVHYRRFKANGDPLVTKQGGKPKSYCVIQDCGRAAFGLGYCNMHYKRFRKHGNTN